ncbi:DNA replication and repair protein RecF [Candidatus Daviesbacteria bacterium]|nr:DNA replication and repair protein RecF [Candidatus Daviesbacteria bacterium]
MFLNSLKLTNFRTYSKLDFKFKSPLTILVGDNAKGKSNFLESIYFLATTKSPKADKDEELIKKRQVVLRVEGELEDKTSLEIVMMSFGSGHSAELSRSPQDKQRGLTKRVKVNKIPKRILDYIGNLAVVSFSPEDINLVTGAPSLRRWHIDLTLAQIDKEYKKVLTQYEEVVIKKNRILKKIKEGLGKMDELTFWLNQQINLGQIVTLKRADFFKFINSVEKKFGDYQFEYLKSETSKERLEEYLPREIASASSLIGPHRDDFKFIALDNGENKDLAHFGSRGEQRTAVLDLKIAEASFVEKILGKRPILLLDDVFSELDLNHREHVIALTELQQTIITAIELDYYLKDKLKEANIFSVENGQLNEITDK